ncbi:hypothetical protein BDR05DRAFT_30021 [Suillus weaverae]|nr:hypothetical protein BDR05DRAFT_30021 [Suillus weaverae]
MTNSDWLQLTLLNEALQEPTDVTQSFSSSKHPTVWRGIPVLEFLQQSWKIYMVANKKFLSISDALEAGLDKLDKWTQKTVLKGTWNLSLDLSGPELEAWVAKQRWTFDSSTGVISIPPNPELSRLSSKNISTFRMSFHLLQLLDRGQFT